MRPARVIVLAIALVAPNALAGCKKKPPPAGSTASTGDPNAPTTGDQTVIQTGVAATDLAPGDPMVPQRHDLPEPESSQNVQVQGTEVVPGTPGAPPVAAPVDPLAGSIASAKAGALPCFSPLPPGEWGATLVVTVTPTGTVTRSEVEPGNVQDAAVISCLEKYAASLSFAPSEGRTVRIDVRVKG